MDIYIYIYSIFFPLYTYIYIKKRERILNIVSRIVVETYGDKGFRVIDLMKPV
jgi:hypothetical protein